MAYVTTSYKNDVRYTSYKNGRTSLIKMAYVTTSYKNDVRYIL